MTRTSSRKEASAASCAASLQREAVHEAGM